MNGAIWAVCVLAVDTLFARPLMFVRAELIVRCADTAMSESARRRAAICDGKNAY